MLSSVDLPQPEWPMIETYSPFSIVSVMSCSTSVSLRAAREGLREVIDLQIGAHGSSSQFAAVPRVTMVATAATMRSSTKPMMPT